MEKWYKYIKGEINMKSLKRKIKDENYIDFGQWLYETRKENGYNELE